MPVHVPFPAGSRSAFPLRLSDRLVPGLRCHQLAVHAVEAPRPSDEHPGEEEPGRGAELSVEPLAGVQKDEDGEGELQPDSGEFGGCERFTSLDGGIAGVDVVMMLRIQKERMATAQIPDADRYFAKFGLSSERLAKAKPDAIVMHPQPMNRGIEIASDVADGPQSVIREQVRNGVAVRMAVLEAVIEGRR